MELLLALVCGTLYASGIYLMLKRRVAQLIVMPITPVLAVAVDALDDTARGEGGFGSTGER